MARRRRSHRRKSALGALGFPLGGSLLLYGGLALAAWWFFKSKQDDKKDGKKDDKREDSLPKKDDETTSAPEAKKPDNSMKKKIRDQSKEQPNNVVPLTPDQQKAADAEAAKKRYDEIESMWKKNPPTGLVGVEFDTLSREESACANDSRRDDCDLISHFIDRCFTVTNGIAKSADDAPRYCFPNDLTYRIHVSKVKRAKANQNAQDEADAKEYYDSMKQQQQQQEDASWEQQYT
jgi:hypothetical protein